MCAQRHWNTSRLLLALPLSNEAPKTNVRLLTYLGKNRVQSMLQWIYQQVGRNVRRLRTNKELSVWIADSCVADVCFLLVTTLSLPPFFLSALSVKFSGRARFATTTPDGANIALPERESTTKSQETSQAPSTKRFNGRYWLISPQGRIRWEIFETLF